MAVLETIRSLFLPATPSLPERITPAPSTTYQIRPLTAEHLPDVLRLNLRCFANGDNYTKHTFEYLLSEPRTISYRMISAAQEMVGFAFVMISDNGSAHLTTLGVAPEHRRRGIAKRLLLHLESALSARDINTVMLEVRVSNTEAQDLYRRAGYMVVQRVGKYYNNGEDCFLMIKALIQTS